VSLIIISDKQSWQSNHWENWLVEAVISLLEVHLHHWYPTCNSPSSTYKTKYEGRSIKKLKNSIILRVFQILEIQNTRFVANLILSNSCKLYDDDVTVTLFINIKYNDVDTKIIP